MEHVRIILATQIKEHRKRLGFKNQNAFAEHCEVSPDTIKKIETGVMWPGPGIMQKIADGLGIPVSELLSDPKAVKVKALAPITFHSALDAYRVLPEDIVRDLSKFTESSPVWKLIRIAIRKTNENGEASGGNHSAKG